MIYDGDEWCYVNPTQTHDPYPRVKTQAERIRALEKSPKTYPQDMPCLHCGRRWMQHMGMLCPETDGRWSTIRDAHNQPIPIPPTFGNRLFVPDELYYNQKPDFDVV